MKHTVSVVSTVDLTGDTVEIIRNGTPVLVLTWLEARSMASEIVRLPEPK
jgi:hypothetical protein